VLIAGCGGGDKAKPKAISGPAKEAAAVVQRLEKATALKDFATICNDLLATATRKQAGGADCESLLDQRGRNIHRPKIVIRDIAVQGQRAQVRVRTTARGQAPVDAVIRLVREQGRFRVSSLGR
jgi:hypothetical protein